MAYNNNFIRSYDFLGKKFGQVGAELLISMLGWLRSHGGAHWWTGWAGGTKMALLTRLSPRWEGWTVVVLGWSCWSLQGDCLKAFRLFTWQLRTPGEHSKKQAVRAPSLLRPGWEIVPMYSAGQNIYRTHPGSRGRDIAPPPLQWVSGNLYPFLICNKPFKTL